MKKSTQKTIVYVVISILAWGSSSTVTKGVLYGMDTMFTLAICSALAAVFLIIRNITNGKIKKLRGMTVKDILFMGVNGTLGVLVYRLLLFLGTWRLPAQEAFVINYLWPALIILFSCIILKEPLTKEKVIAILLSFIGVIIVTTNGNLANFLDSNITGILCCIGAAFSYAIYCVLNKAKSYDSDIAVMIAYIASTIIAFAYLPFIRGLTMPTPHQIIGLVYYGIVCCGIALYTWGLALDYGNTAIVANTAYLTPVLSLLFTHFILGESITIFSVIGLALILFGICIQVISNERSKKLT